jgi:E3 ubiquitin-protein ligase synoviolin
MPQTSTSGVPNPLIPGANSAAPMPPFPFFPPFMAPFAIPPPPMPANLDQLTTEELQAMEGNERKHIEERLKLLKNVNTMINASIAMMNQYQTIVSNLPPIPTPPPAPSTSSEKKDETKITSSSDIKVDTTKVKMEDLGSEEHLDHQKHPSTSSSSPSSAEIPSSSKASNIDSSSTLIANEISSSGDSEEANEIRKRRLQKFMQSN